MKCVHPIPCPRHAPTATTEPTAPSEPEIDPIEKMAERAWRHINESAPIQRRIDDDCPRAAWCRGVIAEAFRKLAAEREAKLREERDAALALHLQHCAYGSHHCKDIGEPKTLAFKERAEKAEAALRLVLGDLSDAERTVRAWRAKASGYGGMGVNIIQEDLGRYPTVTHERHRERAKAVVAATSSRRSPRDDSPRWFP